LYFGDHSNESFSKEKQVPPRSVYRFTVNYSYQRPRGFPAKGKQRQRLDAKQKRKKKGTRDWERIEERDVGKGGRRLGVGNSS